MIELKFGRKTVDLPYTVRIPDVTEDQFDELVVVHSPATIQHDDIGGFVRGLMRFFADAQSRGLVLGPGLASGHKFCPDALSEEGADAAAAPQATAVNSGWDRQSSVRFKPGHGPG
jgi:hypothetical protein